ncbi:MAG: glycosyltransferase [Candidatus Latescibacterota bacterium]|nr:MAG: glycosyltransferase [Candidatus Latescibacterota bacterium]
MSRAPYLVFEDPDLPERSLRVLVAANLYPHEGAENYGTFVRDEVGALRRLGVGVDVFYVNGRASRLNYFRAAPAYLRRTRARGYQLVHAHHTLTGPMARLERRLPLVITFHGSEVAESYTAPLSRLLARLADGRIATSRWVESRLGRPADAIVPPGVDFDLFRPADRDESRRALGLPLDRKLVLFVGLDRPDKRVFVIERAVESLRADGIPADLLRVTDKRHEEIPPYMNAADVLVLVSEAEGSPMVIKEAMGCNLPIVSGDMGDIREVIEGTAGCFLCDKSVEGTAAAIRKALDFGRRTDGRPRVMHLSLEESAKKVRAVYERVLERRGKR